LIPVEEAFQGVPSKRADIEASGFISVSSLQDHNENEKAKKARAKTVFFKLNFIDIDFLDNIKISKRIKLIYLN